MMKRKQKSNGYMNRSASEEWETPWEFFDKLNQEFHFDLDVCASDRNAKCYLFISKERNTLETDWHGTCWMNPPYGKQIKYWMKKAYEESLKGNTVVCLIPSRTDAGWWHDYAMKGEIRFIRGRLKFGGSPYNAPFPNAIVIFRGEKNANNQRIQDDQREADMP